MTYEEFHDRTNYVCGTNEFWAIVSEYNHCSLTKDEFCRRWKVMNRERITTNKFLQLKRNEAVNNYCDARSNWYDCIARQKVNCSHQNLEDTQYWEEQMQRYEELIREYEKALYNA